ncbi:MAG: 50S ribosomal protein L18e, partial [Nanoarchaeota archaeon]
LRTVWLSAFAGSNPVSHINSKAFKSFIKKLNSSKMAKHTGPTTLELRKLIIELRKLASKQKVKLWKRIANDLEKPTRKRREVNLYKINKYTRNNEIALVPGKVLSLGNLDKKLTIAAYQFSKQAKEKINKIGKAITIKELIKENPKGKKVRIIG